MAKMKLLTKEIQRALPPIASTDETPLNDQIVVCKFFTPDSSWSWFVFEGELTPFDNHPNDWLFFGMVHGHVKECGYFRLHELESIGGHLGLPIERDKWVFKTPYRELDK